MPRSCVKYCTLILRRLLITIVLMCPSPAREALLCSFYIAACVLECAGGTNVLFVALKICLPFLEKRLSEALADQHLAVKADVYVCA